MEYFCADPVTQASHISSVKIDHEILSADSGTQTLGVICLKFHNISHITTLNTHDWGHYVKVLKIFSYVGSQYREPIQVKILEL